MKLTKARENLDDFIHERREVPYDDLLESCQLGIEAIDHILNSRVEPRYSSVDPLPSETAE